MPRIVTMHKPLACALTYEAMATGRGEGYEALVAERRRALETDPGTHGVVSWVGHLNIPYGS